MEKNENESASRAQPLYGVVDRALASNDAAQMKAAAEQLRQHQGEVAAALEKLQAAIARMSSKQ